MEKEKIILEYLESQREYNKNRIKELEHNELTKKSKYLKQELEYKLFLDYVLSAMIERL